jgi:hypothetical protein
MTAPAPTVVTAAHEFVAALLDPRCSVNRSWTGRRRMQLGADLTGTVVRRVATAPDLPQGQFQQNQHGQSSLRHFLSIAENALTQ